MTATILPFPIRAVEDAFSPELVGLARINSAEDTALLLDAAEELASRALKAVRDILVSDDFDFEAEAQGLLRAAIGIIILEQEPDGSDAA